MKKALILVSMAAALLAGCSSSKGPQASGTDQGRPETKTLEGASAVGYDGKEVRKTVDTTLNNNDAHNREIDSSLKDADHDQQKH